MTRSSVANGVPSETSNAKTIRGTTYAKSIASRDDFSDSLCLFCSDTANLHQHALVGCNDMLYCAELKQQAIRQSWTDAR